MTKESIDLIKEDVAYEVEAAYAEVILGDKLLQTCPSNLKVSPLTGVPRRNRRGRIILDLAFAARKGKTGRGRKQSREDEVILQEYANDSKVRLAPQAPVKELCYVLPRLLDFMSSVSAEEHIHFPRWTWSTVIGAWSLNRKRVGIFCYIMPLRPGESIIPRALQMG
jgi:hypothetical protein